MTKQFSFSKKQAYLEQFYQSGLTQTAFCRQQGLVVSVWPSTLYPDLKKGVTFR